MKEYIISIILLVFLFGCAKNGDNLIISEIITISGHVKDFDGNAVENCNVLLYHKDFTTAYETKSDRTGYFILENVEKGRYIALYALPLDLYPRANAVPEEDMRLEFWAWNIIAEENITINPRFEKLELYGTTIFETYGGYNGFFVYFRPMSLAKMLSYQKDIWMDKGLAESLGANISVKPEYFDVKVFANDELLKINSITPIEEYGGTMSITGYLVQVDASEKISNKPYIVFRVEGENREDNEKGENIYFYEKLNFK